MSNSPRNVPAQRPPEPRPPQCPELQAVRRTKGSRSRRPPRPQLPGTLPPPPPQLPPPPSQLHQWLRNQARSRSSAAQDVQVAADLCAFTSGAHASWPWPPPCTPRPLRFAACWPRAVPLRMCARCIVYFYFVFAVNTHEEHATILVPQCTQWAAVGTSIFVFVKPYFCTFTQLLPFAYNFGLWFYGFM